MPRMPGCLADSRCAKQNVPVKMKTENAERTECACIVYMRSYNIDRIQLPRASW
jgi:hypothetical protein